MEHSMGHILPDGAHVEAKQGSATVYRVDYPDGWGRMTVYDVMPGVLLSFNDFRTALGGQQHEAWENMVEINHCLRGGFSAQMPGGMVAELGPQDFAVSDMARPPRRAGFLMGGYYGISLVAQLERAQRSLDAVIGPGMVRLKALFERLFWDRSFLVLRHDRRIQHIFSELYAAPRALAPAYFRLKAAELFVFLALYEGGGHMPAAEYRGEDVHQRMEAAARALTQALGRRLPLAQVCRSMGLSKTALYRQFQAVYGETPYAYAKRRRMETAALWLQTTDMPVGRIAGALGYQNASKFSQAFTAFYGVPPTAYKKGVLLD